MHTCPICNGFWALTQACPFCHEPLSDHGRVSDFFGDYSPYQDIELCKRSDGWIDLKSHTCPHQLLCANCGYTTTEMVFESKHY